MPATDAYYDSLFGPETAGAGAGVGAGLGSSGTAGGGLLNKLKSGLSKNKGAVGSILGLLLISKLLEARNQSKDRGVQMEGLQAQAGLATPENLYYAAAQPQARQEAEQARQALFAQVTGGVIGPSLAKGERRIGG